MTKNLEFFSLIISKQITKLQEKHLKYLNF